MRIIFWKVILMKRDKETLWQNKNDDEKKQIKKNQWIRKMDVSGIRCYRGGDRLPI